MIDIDNITFSYRRKGKTLFDGFSLSVGKGCVCGLLGSNGTGKSTLLYLMGGLLAPSKGSVRFDGVDVRLRKPSTLNNMFLVPEEFTLPNTTLKSFIKANAPFYPRFSAEDMDRNLATFDLTPDLHLGELSLGQKKKTLMSFAVACNTSLLLLDEPTNGLDIAGKSAFRRFIATGMTDERSMIISTHQVRDIHRILDHVLILGHNRAIVDSSVSDISSRLSFMTTGDPALIGRSLFARPTLGGTTVILPNNGGDDIEMDLETLYEYAMAAPDEVIRLLNDPLTTGSNSLNNDSHDL